MSLNKYLPIKAITLGGALALSGNTLAGEGGPDSPHTFSANVTMATEYVYRGITQSNEDMTIQGGIDYSHSSGFYVGTWASNLEFNAPTSASNTNASSIEVDIYGGFAGEFSNGIAWDIGGLYYWYPEESESTAGGANYDFVEVYGSLGYEFDAPMSPAVEVGLAYSPDFFGEDGDSIYISSSLGLSLPGGLSPYVSLNYQDVDGDQTSPNGYDYFYFAVGGSYDIGMITLDLSYHDADLDNCTDACEAVVFAVSSSW